MSDDLIDRLRSGEDGLEYAAADELERLQKKCNMQATILRKLTPEKYPGCFISGEIGEKDQNGLPQKLMIVPTYGVDWFMIYERTERTVGPGW